MIKNILDSVNESSQDIFDIRVGTNKYSASEFSFIDRNFIGDKNKSDISLIDKLFEFKPNSPNSIVQGYDLSFTTLIKFLPKTF